MPTMFRDRALTPCVLALRLADIAEITDLTVETVYRMTAALDMEGGLPHRTRQKPGQSRTPQPLAA